MADDNGTRDDEIWALTLAQAGMPHSAIAEKFCRVDDTVGFAPREYA